MKALRTINSASAPRPQEPAASSPAQEACYVIASSSSISSTSKTIPHINHLVLANLWDFHAGTKVHVVVRTNITCLMQIASERNNRLETEAGTLGNTRASRLASGKVVSRSDCAWSSDDVLASKAIAAIEIVVVVGREHNTSRSRACTSVETVTIWWGVRGRCRVGGIACVASIHLDRTTEL